MDLTTKLSNIQLQNCILNASGALCMTLEELKQLNSSQSGAIITKSCTIYEKTGNPRPRYYQNEDISLNSMGLPNLSHDVYVDIANKMSFAKPYILSVAGDTPDNINHILKEAINNDNISGIELNISCPNICDADKILGYHFDEMDKFLSQIASNINGLINVQKPIGIKLPPYWEPYQFIEISKIIVKYNFNFATTLNSVPNCLIIDTENEMPVIKPKYGIGGLGGKYIKPIVLSNIYQLRKQLPNQIQIIGCGGIATGEDIFHHLLAGASLVQIGTVLMQEGPDVFERLNKELIEIMERKNYTKLSDVIGKLKPHDSSIFPNKNLY
jgi:dihydroorotate dehydrogenase (fumarate)